MLHGTDGVGPGGRRADEIGVSLFLGRLGDLDRLVRGTFDRDDAPSAGIKSDLLGGAPG